MKKSPNLIKQGNIFKLGNHYLACGDSRDAEFVSKVVGKTKIKAVVCDPPFGVAVTESKHNFKRLLKDKVIINDHLQSDEEYTTFTQDWIETIKPHLERKNVFYIFNSDKMIFALREGMRNASCKFGQLLIWVKTQAVIGRMDYAPQHELIAYGWYGVHEFLKSKDKSVIIYPKPNRSPFHPTTKPVGLIRHLVLNSTRIGDVVFDGFLGSGTTLLACEQTKRICIGIEIDPEYVQTTISRFEKLTGVKTQKIA
ncbi:MAG: modification methylase protein [Parcubacteria group bacterium GW2011_GWC1_35_21]|uniref:Methyltransferase n=1 Tax=Candidatus Nomurabacteria bacterium GW2011_GWA1_36_15 TaxID=1618728 RepID=A0A0G0DXM8_9BACT|nr:MAG: modification methylase protein [Parcubacteria group bacterium GW2011_GWC1_35_21]KKP97998.1 MAG: modification methylase protein [Candidatus Nomurabacteria bacterium GW2011_GWA1_36_15]